MGMAPGYVLDEMEMYEVNALMEHRHLRNRESWEQTRTLAFVSARCAGSKIDSAKKLFEFPWDKEEDSRPNLSKAPATEEDEARLKATARYLLENGLMD